MSQHSVLGELLLCWEERTAGGQEPSVEELCRDCPELAPTLAARIEVMKGWLAARAAIEARTVPQGEEPAPGSPCLPVFPQVPGYEVLEEVGRGGMGVVFKARQLSLDRIVALKVIRSGSLAGPAERQRFLAEAEAVARVSHPGIVEVYDYGTHGGLPYLALEFCAGGNLAASLAGSPLSDAQAAECVGQLCRAVQAAHEAGVLHRDLKPANVLLANGGCELKITDFGLAKRLDGEGPRTGTGQPLGTLGYMAPEQTRGERAVGPAADVYALGAILYECLTGRPPFLAATVFELTAQLNREPVPPRQLNPRVPRDLEVIALKCLHREPEKRYASAADLADDLARWQAGEPVRARPAGRLERARKWARRRPALASLLAISLLSVLALTGFAFFASWQQQVAAASLRRAEAEQQRRLLAQRESTRARLAALRDATPDAVPALLAQLRSAGADLRPHLEDLHARERDPSRRTRLALALLNLDPDAVREELAASMLEADGPAEVLLVRDRLQPWAATLTAWLWKKAEDPGSKPQARFRAHVALAGFDPENPRWEKTARATVAELLSARSVNRQAWARALRPVRQALLPALGQAFRERKQPQAQSVALVLAEYAADRPELLADLLLDADEQQYAVLRPALAQHPKRAAARLRRELTALPPAWNDPSPDPARQRPADSLRREVESAGGLFDEHFALCQSLPLRRLEAVAEGLRSAGYRPVRLRPWNQRDSVLVAVVWTRDGRDWKLRVGLTADQVAAGDRNALARGLIPADVAGYRTPEGERYALLWRTGEKGEQPLVCTAVPLAKHAARVEELSKTGFVPTTVQALVRSDGQVLVAGVWHKGSDEEQAVLLWDRGEANHGREVQAAERLLVDVDLSAAASEAPEHKWQRVLKQADQELQARPGGRLALFHRGLALFHLRRDEQALRVMDEVLTGKEAGSGLCYLRALLLARLGRIDEARQQARMAAAAAWPDRPVFEAQVRVELHAGQEESALGQVEQAVRARPRDPHLLAIAAGSYAEASGLARMNSTKAASHARRALALLERAVREGYRDFADLEEDPALAPLWQQPDYRALVARAGGRRRYASVWCRGGHFEAEGPHGLPPQAHLARCRELAAAGYRPVALSLAAVPGERVPVAASVWHRPVQPESRQQWWGRRQATAAATLAHLGETSLAWSLFRHGPDPTARSFLIQRAKALGVDPRLLVERLQAESDDSIRRALILALGEYDDRELPPAVRRPVIEKLLVWYRNDPDPGVHGAIDWLLRHAREGPVARRLDWGQRQALEALDRELHQRWSEPPRKERAWYVNHQGMTFSVIRPRTTFLMGSRHTDRERSRDERRHERRLPRSFALATRPVTLALWQQFQRDRKQLPLAGTGRYRPDLECPMSEVTWYEAARFCNWLSEKEGISREQWCYPDEIKEGMRPIPDYLRRTGYRLPTDAEYEYACRAGSVTTRFYGEGAELLPRYAWGVGNSSFRTWPVGQKRPNDLGLFDMLGNVDVWCQESAFSSPPRRCGPLLDEEDTNRVRGDWCRVLRGGSFTSSAAFLRSAVRVGAEPGVRRGSLGLRVARTWPFPGP